MFNCVPRTAAGETSHRVDALVVTAGVGGTNTLIFVHALVEVQVQLEPLQDTAL